MNSEYISEDLFEVVLGKQSARGAAKKIRSSNGKGNKAGGLLASYMRLVGNTPEVMVKVTGGATIAAQAKAHLAYITRNGKLDVYSSERDREISLEEGKDILNDEWDIDNQFGSGKYRQTQNIILSMPKGTDREKTLEAAKDFAQKHFGENHSYMLVQHNDTEHPHVHILVNSNPVKERGKRLRITKDSLQDYRETFAEKLRDRGIEANATRSIQRGKQSQTKSIARYYAEKKVKSWVAHAKMKAASEIALKEYNSAMYTDSDYYKALKALSPDQAKFEKQVTDAQRNQTFSALYKENKENIDENIAMLIKDIGEKDITPQKEELLSALRSLSPTPEKVSTRRNINQDIIDTHKKSKEVKPWVKNILLKRRDLLRAHFLIMKRMEAAGKIQEAAKIQKYLDNFPSLQTEKEKYLKQARSYIFQKKESALLKEISTLLVARQKEGATFKNLVADRKHEEAPSMTEREIFMLRKKRLDSLGRELKGLQGVSMDKFVKRGAQRAQERERGMPSRSSPRRSTEPTKTKDKSRGR